MIKFNFDLTLFYLGGEGAKMPYPSGFFKYLKNYLLNWLESFKSDFPTVWTVLKKILKTGVRKALNHALSWMTSYGKKSPSDKKTFLRLKNYVGISKKIKNHKISIQCCKYVGFTYSSTLYCYLNKHRQ